MERRIRRYQDGEVHGGGDVPKHWEMLRLKFFLTLRSERSVKRMKEGDLFIVTEGREVGEVFWGEEDDVLCRGVIVTVDKRVIDCFFLFFFLQAYRELFVNSFNGLGVPQFDRSALLEHYFAFPSIEEQKKIAIFLTDITGKIDALIGEKKNLLGRLEQEQTIFVGEVVVKGLVPNVPVKDSGVEGLGYIPAHWKVVPFKWLVSLRTGVFVSVGNRYSEWQIGMQEYVTIKSVTSRGCFREYIMDESAYVCREEDVLLCRRGRIFGEIISGVSGVLSTDFLLIDYDRDVFSKDFLLYYLRHPVVQDMLRFTTRQKIAPVIRACDFDELMCLVPPSLEEQQAIGRFISEKVCKQMEVIQELREQIVKLEEYRKAVIGEAISGKLSLNEDKYFVLSELK